MSEIRNVKKSIKCTETEESIINKIVNMRNENISSGQKKESFNNYIIASAVERAKKEIKEIEKAQK